MQIKKTARLLLPAGLVLLAACSPTVTVHGYVPSEDDLAKIEPGTSTIATVEETLGRPATTSLLGNEEWYYVQSTMEQLTYNPPRVTDRRVVAVAFAEDGTVTDVQSYGLEDGRIVNLSPRVTPTGGQRVSMLRRVFAGLLNFDPTSAID